MSKPLSWTVLGLMGVAFATGVYVTEALPFVPSECRAIFRGQASTDIEVLYSKELPVCIVSAKPNTSESEIEALKQIGRELIESSTLLPVAESAKEIARERASKSTDWRAYLAQLLIMLFTSGLGAWLLIELVQKADEGRSFKPAATGENHE